MISGAPQNVIDLAMTNMSFAEDDCMIWQENWDSVMLFLTLSTQWIIAPMGGAIGVNYVAVESVMNLNNIKNKDRQSLFADIRVMESSALRVMREKQQ